MARVGFALGASALQCITLIPHHRGFADNGWFDLNIYSNNPNPNPNPNLTLTLTLTLTLCTNH